jgi:hypothetical protein
MADGPAGRMSAAMRVETTAVLDMGEVGRVHAHVARPAMTADLARVCERMLEQVAAADATTNAERERIDSRPSPAAYPFGTAVQFFGFAAKLAHDPIAASRPLTHTIGGIVYVRAFATSQNAAMGRDAAAIALAMRLYELDHAGAWPTKLEELVPDYLPAIPKNKVSSDDAPYGYQLVPHGLPDGRDRPILVKSGQPLVRDKIPIERTHYAGQVIELSSLARAEPATTLPTTIPAVAPTTQP